MFRVYVRYDLKPGVREEFLSRLESIGLRRAVLAEAGCLQYDYYRAVDDPDQVLLAELLADRRAQQIHLEQPHMRAMPAIKEEYVRQTGLETFEV